MIASVLDAEDDEEGHLLTLHIIHDLMVKSKGKWIERHIVAELTSRITCEPMVYLSKGGLREKVGYTDDPHIESKCHSKQY